MKTTLMNGFIDARLGTATGFVGRRGGGELGREEDEEETSVPFS